METRVYKTLDRSQWTHGEWDDEPDKIQWQDATTGYPCLAVRHSYFGHWCGYVGVGPNHSVYQSDYDSVDVTVHGGLTFSSHCSASDDESTGICHAVENDDKTWWLGFDCAHHGDEAPRNTVWVEGGRYRTLSYVQHECAMLAAQLKNIKRLA